MRGLIAFFILTALSQKVKITVVYDKPEMTDLANRISSLFESDIYPQFSSQIVDLTNDQIIL